MNISTFNVSLRKAEKFLREAKLLKSKGIKPNGQISDEFKKISKSGLYFEIYKTGIENLDYTFLLNDDSFFQFSFKDSELRSYPYLRYSFFQNPQFFISYDEFLKSELNEEYSNDDFIFHEEYQQYLTELEINSSAVTFRYDMDFSNYKPLIHSASHLHIGLTDNFRITCKKIISPLAFVIFATKNMYYAEWKKLINNYESFNLEYLEGLKNSCMDINSPYWMEELDGKEFFLG
jgi:hypothetical protein